MKILSLTEPYATLIANGNKCIETRSWKTNYRGELYIHASMTKVKKEDLNNRELMNLVNIDELNFGHVICKCKLVDCIYMTEEYVSTMKKNNYKEFICGCYEVGRYAWILEDIVVLENSFPVKGHLGIWNLEIDSKKQ